MHDLVPDILRRVDAGEAVAFCAVVATRGSAPQRAGAAMLVTTAGQTRGTLGGGCVEAEVRTRAMRLLHAGESRLLSFTLNHDYGWDDGLVCGGVMEIAVQTVSKVTASTDQFRDVAAALGERRIASLTLDVRDETGVRRAYTLPVEPPPRLIVAGAGHVGAALAGVAATAGFEVTVIDDRADLVTSQRLPDATCVVGDIDHELSRVLTDATTYVVIVTRGHRHDEAALAAALRRPSAYVGLIGSKSKIVRIFRRLRDSGVSVESLARIHAPVGLGIGSVEPGEIAVSIVAELIAMRRRAALPAHPLRVLTTPVGPAASATLPIGRPEFG